MKPTLIRMSKVMLTLTTVLLSACNIYEDRSCPPMHVEFKYDYNMFYQNLFAEQCNKIELFIFNDKGILVERIAEEGNRLKDINYKMPVRLNDGAYTFMAWGGHKDSYSLHSAVIGATSITEMTLRLNSIDNHSKKKLEPLWNGTPISVSVRNGHGGIETINLIKNTKHLNITLHSKNESFNAEDVAIEVKCANGSYLYDNSKADDTEIIYSPFQAENKTELEASFAIDLLRLVKGDKAMLSIIDKKTGKSMLPTDDIDLIDLLLKTIPYGMSAQEYLDREAIWDFSLYTKESFIAIMIQINGWTVWSQDNEL